MWAQLYSAVVGRLLDLAPSLSEAQRSVVPQPTPDWTVVDTYRHLTGAAADILDDHLQGRGTPEWTAAQVSARAHLNLEEICAELAESSPDVAGRIGKDRGLAGFVVGFWVHEQDIRGAVGSPLLREDPRLADMTQFFLDARAKHYEESGAATLRVIALDRSVDSVLGTGTARLSITATTFELLRMISSRRSLNQCLAARWTGGDAASRTAAIEALAAFRLPKADLRE